MSSVRYVRLPLLGCLFLLAACPSSGENTPGLDEDADAGEILPVDGTDGAVEHDPAAHGGAGSNGKPSTGSGKPTPAAGNGDSAGAAGSGTAGSTAAGSGSAGASSNPAAGTAHKFFLPTPEPTNTTAPRVEVDRKGGVHAVYPAYGDGSAYYAYCPNNCLDPQAMKVVTLPTDGVPGSAMLALTPDGRPRVILPTYLRIYYAECDQQCTDVANWTVSVIVEHSGDQDATGEALAVDSQGRPRFLLHTYLAFLGVGQKAPQTLYAQCDTGCTSPANWSMAPIGDSIWQNSTLRFDAMDHPHVGTVVVDKATNTKQLAYLSCAGGDCTTMAAWTGIGLGTAFEDQTQEIKPSISLALTAAGAPRVIALSKLETGERSLMYFECDQQCGEDNWRGTVMSKLPQLGAGVDIAVDAKNHPRFVFTLNDNIGLYSCDEADCVAEAAKWTLTKVEFAADLPPDGIILWPNCSIDAWMLHSPTLALTADGAVRVGYQATDLSGGVTTIDPTKPACVAGKDMTLSRMALLLGVDGVAAVPGDGAGSAAAGSGGVGGRAGSAAAGSSGSANAGSPAAGSGGSASSGSAIPGAAKLAAVTTDSQAEAICDVLRAKLDPKAFDVLERGACTLEGLTGELQGRGDCETLSQTCLNTPVSVDPPVQEHCTAADIPDCADVSVDEYIACTLASVQSSAEFFGDLTCKTDLTTLSDLRTPTACVGPYQRCPALNSSSEDSDS